MIHHRFTSPGGHQLAYTHWGNSENPQGVLCLHGLTRNRRDFDNLAQALADDYRVICLDLVGRGESDWLVSAQDYDYPIYLADTLALLKHLHLKRIDLIGTSLGGLIGMRLAAQPDSPIKRLVLNDIGAWVPKTGLVRIAHYLTQPPPSFATLEEVEKYVRTVHCNFGILTEAQWQHLARHSVRALVGGGYRLAYDPQIAWCFSQESIEEINGWSIWEQVDCPVLLLHGEYSDLLSTSTIERMQAIHPMMEVVTFPNVGHAPALQEEAQIQVIRKWLKKFQ